MTASREQAIVVRGESMAAYIVGCREDWKMEKGGGVQRGVSCVGRARRRGQKWRGIKYTHVVFFFLYGVRRPSRLNYYFSSISFKDPEIRREMEHIFPDCWRNTNPPTNANPESSHFSLFYGRNLQHTSIIFDPCLIRMIRIVVVVDSRISSP